MVVRVLSVWRPLFPASDDYMFHLIMSAVKKTFTGVFFASWVLFAD